MKKHRKLPLFSTLLLYLCTLFVLSAQNPTRFANEVDTILLNHRSFSENRDVHVFTGSSSIRMWTSIQEDLTSPAHIVNTGFGGSEFSDLLFFMDQLVVSFRPKKVFIYEGDNDIFNGKSARKTYRHAKRLFRKLKRVLPQTAIYFIAAKPSVARWGKKKSYQRFNLLLARFAERKDIGFIDVWNPMLNEEGEPIKELFIDDKLHMNEKGYSIWKDVIQPYLEE